MKDLQQRWTISAARAYQACPRMWWLTRVANVAQVVDPDSHRGVLLHAALAAGYEELVRALADGSSSFVTQQRRDSAVVHAMVTEADRLKVPYSEEAADTAIRALEHLGPQPGDEFLGAEDNLDIEHNGVPIRYRVDLLYRRDGVLVVRDWKSAAPPKARDLLGNRQLALGALCAARVFDANRVDVEIASINAAVAVSTPANVAVARSAGDVVVAVAGQVAADTEFETRKGTACNTCRVTAACPVYAADGVMVPIPGPGGTVSSQEVIKLDVPATPRTGVTQ